MLTPSTEESTPYDEMPYPSAAFPQTHPNRLAGIGRLFGLAAADPSTARVLELGCADGSNLLPMAEQSPHASYLGLDASKVQIATGQAAIAAAGLKNVELRQQDILEFAPTEGKYDYIIAHGVYSWVPESVRSKILAICSEHLTENGVAYISYNALPGWNMRQSLRDMMLFHTRGRADPASRVRQARALLKFLADSVPSNEGAYAQFLQSELKNLADKQDNYLRHDILEEENTAYYFHEFMAQAAQHGMQYLGEPRISQMLAANFPDKVARTLAQAASNVVAQEQYMDFLRNRVFRETLLCRSEIPLSRTVGVGPIRQLAFHPRLKPLGKTIDLSPGVPLSFAGAGGQRVTTSDAFLKAAFVVLDQVGAGAISFLTLLSAARAHLPRTGDGDRSAEDGAQETILAENLVWLLGRGFIDVQADPLTVASTVPERPALTPLMRYQALTARAITNRIHIAIPADSFARQVMNLCDGTRTQAEIIEVLVSQTKAGALSVLDARQAVVDPGKMREVLVASVERALTGMARTGFFAGA